MRLRISIRGRIRPSVRLSRVISNMAVFEGKESSNDKINNDKMSDDGVVASDVPSRFLFSSLSRFHLSRPRPFRWSNGQKGSITKWPLSVRHFWHWIAVDSKCDKSKLLNPKDSLICIRLDCQ